MFLVNWFYDALASLGKFSEARDRLRVRARGELCIGSSCMMSLLGRDEIFILILLVIPSCLFSQLLLFLNRIAP